jgi:hypothetical protein
MLWVRKARQDGQEGELTTCTTTFYARDPVLGTVTYDAAVIGFFTPRGR